MAFNLYDVLQNDLSYGPKSISVTKQLARSDYSKVKVLLERLGGVWNSSAQQFDFTRDPELLIQRVVDFGSQNVNKWSYYPSTQNVFDFMKDHTSLEFFGAGDRTLKVLEPSAGEGFLIKSLLSFAEQEGRSFDVAGYDIDPINVLCCQEHGLDVTQSDFLDVTPEPIYDLICMNPPFSGETFIKHIFHAQKFLKPDGVLLSVIPVGWHTRAKSKGAQDLLEQIQLLCPENLDEGNFLDKDTFKGVSIDTAVIELRSREWAAKRIECKEHLEDRLHQFALYAETTSEVARSFANLESTKSAKSASVFAQAIVNNTLANDEWAHHFPVRFKSQYKDMLIRNYARNLTKPVKQPVSLANLILAA